MCPPAILICVVMLSLQDLSTLDMYGHFCTIRYTMERSDRGREGFAVIPFHSPSLS